MKKILSPKSPQLQTATLRAELKRLTLAHHQEIAAVDFERFEVREAWALKDERVKVSVELRLKDGRYQSLTRIVPFALPPEMKTSYRDWTIITKPTWYGYRYQLLDESGATVSESEEDLVEPTHVEQNARREIDRLIAEGVKVSATLAAKPAGASPAPKTTTTKSLAFPVVSYAADSSHALSLSESEELVPVKGAAEPLARVESGGRLLPAMIAREGQKTAKRFLEFFTANIRNKNTREAYYRDVTRFLDWCDERRANLRDIEPMIVAAYIEKLTNELAPQTVKQHLAAIRVFCDWMVIGQELATNPASSVRGPRYSIKKGKTPALSGPEMKRYLEKIDASEIIGLRDRALIGLMAYSFGRVSAVAGMKVKDYFPRGRRWFIRLHEKNGKEHEVPVHHKADEYLHAYVEAAGIAGEKNAPLFQTVAGRSKKLTGNAMDRVDVYKMVRRRALEAGIKGEISPHTFRATGITVYLENGGALEHAQQIAAHESARTTKLYDRRGDEVSLDEIERIVF